MHAAKPTVSFVWDQLLAPGPSAGRRHPQLAAGGQGQAPSPEASFRPRRAAFRGRLLTVSSLLSSSLPQPGKALATLRGLPLRRLL